MYHPACYLSQAVSQIEFMLSLHRPIINVVHKSGCITPEIICSVIDHHRTCSTPELAVLFDTRMNRLMPGFTYVRGKGTRYFTTSHFRKNISQPAFTQSIDQTNDIKAL